MSWWNDFWLDLHRKLLKAKTQPKGPVSAGIIVELGSMYSVEDERMRDRKELLEACRSAIEEYPPKKNDKGEVIETYCNWALRDIALTVGCGELRDKTANQIHKHALNNPQLFIQDSGERAAAHAMRGGFAFASQTADIHGHVAAVAPMEMEFSGSWNKKVPVLANVGKENGMLRSSKCFRTEPTYFLWGETA